MLYLLAENGPAFLAGPFFCSGYTRVGMVGQELMLGLASLARWLQMAYLPARCSIHSFWRASFTQTLF